MLLACSVEYIALSVECHYHYSGLARSHMCGHHVKFRLSNVTHACRVQHVKFRLSKVTHVDFMCGHHVKFRLIKQCHRVQHVKFKLSNVTQAEFNQAWQEYKQPLFKVS